jgi:hypothetical protein
LKAIIFGIVFFRSLTVFAEGAVELFFFKPRIEIRGYSKGNKHRIHEYPTASAVGLNSFLINLTASAVYCTGKNTQRLKTSPFFLDSYLFYTTGNIYL